MLGLGSGLCSGSSLDDLFGTVSGFSLSLDGEDDRVTLSEEITLAVDGDGSDHTISFWSKRVSSETRDTVLGAHSDVGSVQSNFKTKLELTTTPELAIESEENGEEATAAITDNTGWHHYAVTWNGQDGAGNTAQPIMYEDGAAVTTVAGNFGKTANQDFIFDTIGAVNNTTSGEHEFRGLLYQLAIWNTTLDDTTIRAVYNSGNPIPVEQDSGDYNNSSNLIHLYKFNEGSGAITKDSVNDNIEGTLKEEAEFSTTVPG